MKKTLLFLFLCYNITSVRAQHSTWVPVPVKTATVWADKVNPQNALPEYPRPQMVRKEWENLNGLWDYSIADKTANAPEKYQGKILVPYGVESSLSGVKKAVNPDQKLWYKKLINIPANWQGRDVILHFDAVDWETTLWVNGQKVGMHTGGSDPFIFNITPFLKKGQQQEIILSVWDPTDTGTQPRGKQVLNPKGIFYTAVTGIWQTVWMEPVNKTHINTIIPQADVDHHRVIIKNQIEGVGNGQLIIKVLNRGKVIAQKTSGVNQPVSINIANPKLWSPARPFLYDLDVQLISGGKTVDRVKSYFAMRKISVAKDALGYERLMLNNKFVFQFGTLDQGWWPESLLTPPTYAAMQYDMDMLKRMGFNMVRKHIKVEPSRYYHYADSVGLFIWQDMPSGMATEDMDTQYIKPGNPNDWQRPAASAREWEKEWKAIMDHLKFFPSIVTWIPFNEGWGQFDTQRIFEWTKKNDPTRIVDGVSGWEDRGAGDVLDAHVYPGPGMNMPQEGPGRVIVLGEFGGLGLPIENHLWNPDLKNWGYRTYKTNTDLQRAYESLIHNLYPMISRGLSAAVYTQTTDIESEVNGLMTYDRKIAKIDPAKMRSINSILFKKPTSTRVIFSDSELSPQILWRIDSIAINKAANKTINKVTGPVRMDKGEHAVFAKNFSIKKLPKNIQLRLFAHSDIDIYINGKLIVSKFVDSERQMDELNLSAFAWTLKTGYNQLVINVKNAVKPGKFDMGLYQF